MRKYEVEESANLQLGGICDRGLTHYNNFKYRYLAIKPHLSNVADEPRNIRFVYTDPPYRNEHGQTCRLVILFRIEGSPELHPDTGEVLNMGLVEIMMVSINTV